MSLDTENIFVDTAERIFADLSDLQEVTSAKTDQWKDKLWSALEENGLTLAMVPEDKGGAGLALDEAFALLGVAGRFGIAVPLAETMLANWALATAGLDVAEGVAIPLCPGFRGLLKIAPDGTVTGNVRDVAFGREAKTFAALCDGEDGPVIAAIDPSVCTIREGVALSFDPADAVEVNGKATAHAPAGDAANLLMMGACARAQLMAGAMERMLDVSVQYSTEREAFTRKISKFQAVQHLLAVLGEEAAAAVAAANSAADTLARGETGTPALLEVGGAKIRCGEAAERAVEIAHQVHGAIGFTREHPLHRVTLRALSWREDFGTEAHWAVELGRAVAGAGSDALWPLLASR